MNTAQITIEPTPEKVRDLLKKSKKIKLGINKPFSSETVQMCCER